MASSNGQFRKERNLALPVLLLIIAITIVGGTLYSLSHPGIISASFLSEIWPSFLILGGLIRLGGYALYRRPRSTVSGVLMIVAGCVIFILKSGLSDPIALYGRYWPAVLATYAILQLIKFYSHREEEGRPPAALTPWRIIVVVLIIATGLAASRAGSIAPGLASRLKISWAPDGIILPIGSTDRGLKSAVECFGTKLSIQ